MLPFRKGMSQKRCVHSSVRTVHTIHDAEEGNVGKGNHILTKHAQK